MRSRGVGRPRSGRLCLPDTQGPVAFPSREAGLGKSSTPGPDSEHPGTVSISQKWRQRPRGRKEPKVTLGGGQNPAFRDGSPLRGSECRPGCSGESVCLSPSDSHRGLLRRGVPYGSRFAAEAPLCQGAPSSTPRQGTGCGVTGQREPRSLITG